MSCAGLGTVPLSLSGITARFTARLVLLLSDGSVTATLAERPEYDFNVSVDSHASLVTSATLSSALRHALDDLVFSRSWTLFQGSSVVASPPPAKVAGHLSLSWRSPLPVGLLALCRLVGTSQVYTREGPNATAVELPISDLHDSNLVDIRVLHAAGDVVGQTQFALDQLLDDGKNASHETLIVPLTLKSSTHQRSLHIDLQWRPGPSKPDPAPVASSARPSFAVCSPSEMVAGGRPRMMQMVVRVKAVSNLAVRSSTYVAVSVRRWGQEPVERTTHVVERTKNPVWNESLDMGTWAQTGAPLLVTLRVVDNQRKAVLESLEVEVDPDEGTDPANDGQSRLLKYDRALGGMANITFSVRMLLVP
ncbi:hypothetical protein PBRA_002680 [Plasmodiophora brassicae]|nr:hypothetical protein PBRA_002680 [Plasmodiophora brassicae]